MPQSDRSKGPVFIGGLDNSGKTHLRLALSAHPNLAMTRRMYMWTRVYKQYGDLGQRENFERCLNALLRKKDIHILQPDAERIRREFWQGAPTYPRLFEIIQEQYAERLDKPRWGEQEGSLEHYAVDIFSAYPSAKIIHMVRDPRNRYDEMLRTTPPKVRLGRVGINTLDWLQSVKAARLNQEQYPANYLALAYEQLVSEPERTLREVCEFIEEEYIPAMLTLDGAISFGRENEAGTSSELETGVVNFHLDGLQVVSIREAAFIQTYARKEMNARGYAAVDIHLSPADAFMYYSVDLPFGLTRAALWQIGRNQTN